MTNQDDRRPMELRLSADPWQNFFIPLTEPVVEKVSASAGLMLLEIWHHHCANRLFQTNRQAGIQRLGAATLVAQTRANLTGVAL